MKSYNILTINNSLIIIIIIIFILLICQNNQINKIKKTTHENATNTSSVITDAQLTAINNQISSIYNMDVEAIRNLGAISKSLLTGTNYHSTAVGVPGELTIPANNTVFKGDIIVDGKIEFTNKDTLLMNIFPRGMIISFNSNDPPLGWTLCNGENGSPDLRGRFVLGSGEGIGLTNRIINTTGGEENHTLTIPEMPRHNHSDSYPIHNYPGSDGGGNGYAGVILSWGNSGYTGGTQPHNNMPPFYVLTYIMKL
jgi:microcystin-dependent protein